MFEGAAGVKLLHVPYQGIGPVFQGLLAGDIDVTQGSPPIPAGYKMLASVGSKRSPLFPELPTLEEVGVKGATWDQWFGFFAPKSLPKPIADKLIADIMAVLRDPATIAKFDERGKLTPEVQPLTGEAFKQQVIQENKQWKTIVDKYKITVE
jgi:tripartite-type tricarboxylate transporter receptor subunit TctC